MKKYTIIFFMLLIYYTVWAYQIQIPKAVAHPHIFISQQLNLVFNDDGLAGIKVSWKFDDMFASMIAKDHDKNQNGKFETNEIQTVKEKAFSFISEHSYFTFIKIENKAFFVKTIKDFNAILEKKKLIYEFFVPCQVLAANKAKKISVATYDPTYYTAIYFTQKEPFSIVGADSFLVKTDLKEDPDTKIYFDMIHPWTLFVEFQQKI